MAELFKDAFKHDMITHNVKKPYCFGGNVVKCGPFWAFSGEKKHGIGQPVAPVGILTNPQGRSVTPGEFREKTRWMVVTQGCIYATVT